MLTPHRCAPSLTRSTSSAWPTWPPRSMLFTYCIARVSTSDWGKERKRSSLPARGLRRTRSPPNISFIGTVYGAMDILYWYTDLNVSLYIRHSGSSIAKSSNDEAEVAVEVIGTFAHGVSKTRDGRDVPRWWSEHPVLAHPRLPLPRRSNPRPPVEGPLSPSPPGDQEMGRTWQAFFRSPPSGAGDQRREPSWTVPPPPPVPVARSDSAPDRIRSASPLRDIHAALRTVSPDHLFLLSGHVFIV